MFTVQGEHCENCDSVGKFHLKMPSLDTEDALDQTNDDNRADNTLSGPIIGIIYPPPEVRSKLNLQF